MTTSASTRLPAFNASAFAPMSHTAPIARRLSRPLLIVALAASSLLAACGGGGADADTGTASAQAVAASPVGSGGTGSVGTGTGTGTSSTGTISTGSSTDTSASAGTEGDATATDATDGVRSAQGFTAAAAGSAVLSWKATTGVVSYRVYYGTSSRSYYQNLGGGVGTPTPSITISGLTSGQTYWFSVTGVDANGKETAYSDEMTKVIL